MSKLDPKFQAKLQDLVESGLGPEEIIQHFREEDEKKALDAEEGTATFEEAAIPEEVRVIAQALAYRGPEEGDLKPLLSLINNAYAPESRGGPESFRTGQCISKESLGELLSGGEYRWLIVEAPGRTNGEGGSLILGAACYSTSGKSKRNGVVEGNLGSIRFFCVDPTFQKLYVGKRMLYRLEKALKLEGCVRAMFSVPSPRKSLSKWLGYQGYDHVGSIPYPAKYLSHELGDVEVMLDMYSASLLESDTAPADYEAQGKDSKKLVEQPSQQNAHLPPHWRGVRSASGTGAATVDINVNALKDSAQVITDAADKCALEVDDAIVDIPDVD